MKTQWLKQKWQWSQHIQIGDEKYLCNSASKSVRSLRSCCTSNLIFLPSSSATESFEPKSLIDASLTNLVSVNSYKEYKRFNGEDQQSYVIIASTYSLDSCTSKKKCCSLLDFKKQLCYLILKLVTTSSYLYNFINFRSPALDGKIAQWLSACPRTMKSAVQASHDILLWRWALHLHLAPAAHISIMLLRPVK